MLLGLLFDARDIVLFLQHLLTVMLDTVLHACLDQRRDGGLPCNINISLVKR